MIFKINITINTSDRLSKILLYCIIYYVAPNVADIRERLQICLLIQAATLRCKKSSCCRDRCHILLQFYSFLATHTVLIITFW